MAVAEEGKAEHERVMHRETVKNTARLAMLTLREEEEARMSREFNAIVDFAGELAGLQREAPRQPRRWPDESCLRPDEPGESLSIQQVLQNAKTVSGRLITVPRTFE